ncbi:hypothetical protein NLG07_07900 [Alteromonas sp. LMIT006]|uniref:hypothetical protein n=1 Tax=Alteromonadaceae TaxID=72275 RepID=UPI0020CA7AA5|nr:hypothetical protein [Alteromonas sp. LMIT006]UTP71933.1 hypothetical protein NLG07_07900 [Alteromonas sp. LMIT006]
MYPTVSFKRSLVYSAVLTALTVPFSKAVFAAESIDPTKNSAIKLIQVNDQTKDKNHATLTSNGQGGIVITTKDDSEIIQNVLTQYVNRGTSGGFTGNILDITVNNDDINSQNTFYLSQIGGSWLVMNVNGKNNTFTIVDLAGVGYDPDGTQPSGAVTINVAGDDNTIDISPTVLGNIAKTLHVDVASSDQASPYNNVNVIHLAYTDFSEITTKLVDASYSFIDVEQKDLYFTDAADTELLPNIVTIDVVNAIATRVEITQNGINNIANVDVKYDQNTINITQDSPSTLDNNVVNVNVSGLGNRVTTTQTVLYPAEDASTNDIDVDIVQGYNNIVTVTQNSYGRINPDSTADVDIHGSGNQATIDQSIDIGSFGTDFDWGASQDITLNVTGDDNIYSLKGFWHHRSEVALTGHGNTVTLSDTAHTTGTVGDIDITGHNNTLEVIGKQSSTNFFDKLYQSGDDSVNYSFTVFGNDNTTTFTTLGFVSLSSLIDGADNDVNLNINSWSHNDINSVLIGDDNALTFNIGANPNNTLYGHYGQSNVTSKIIGHRNDVTLSSTFLASDWVGPDKNNYDIDVSGNDNSLVVQDNRNGGSNLDVDVLGHANTIQIGSQETGLDTTKTFVYVAGEQNIVTLDAHVNDSYMHVEGTGNDVTMTGAAVADSHYRSFIRGIDNTVDIDVTGLTADAYVDVSGNNNVMSFHLGAGYIDYDLVGSGFEGSVKTFNSQAYYQTLSKLGTGTITMISDGGQVNISSNMGG